MAGISRSTFRYQRYRLGIMEGQVRELKEDLRKAHEDLNVANKASEKLKEQLEQEYRGRRVARRKCFKLKAISTYLIEITSDLATFSAAQGRKHCVGDDGCLLDNGDLEMLEKTPENLQILLEKLEDAKSEEDLNDLDDVLFEIMERFKLLKSKLGRAAALSDADDYSKTVEDEEGNCDNDLQIETVPIPPSNETEHAVGHSAPNRIPEARGEFDSGEAVKSGGPRTSENGSESALNLSSSFTSQSSSGLGSTQDEQFMHVDNDEDGQTEVAAQRSRHPVPATTSNIKHGISPGNYRQCLCGYTSLKGVLRHIRRVTEGRHTLTGTHLCSICGDRFRSLQSLQNHFALHQPTAGFTKAIPAPIKTEAMDAAYDGMPILATQSPVASTSGSMMPDTAPKDNLQTTSGLQSSTEGSASNAPQSHYIIVNSNGYSCVCGKVGATKLYLQTHVRSETEELKFRCPSCGKRFLFQCLLKRHCVKSHKMVNPAPGPTFKCHLCEESFLTINDYFDHQYAMHMQVQSK